MSESSEKSVNADGQNESLSELLVREEAKRERNWDPQVRWKVIQETLAWCEAQATVRRNTPAACLAEQQRKLAWLAEREETPSNREPLAECRPAGPEAPPAPLETLT